MNEIASPIERSPRFIRTVAVLSAVVLLASLGAAYQVGVRAQRAPSFTVGGHFADPDGFPSPGVDGRGYPYGNVLEGTTTIDSTTVPTAPTATGAPVSGIPAAAAPSPTVTTATAADPRVAPTGPTPPAPGIYAYALDGSEGATGFGSRSYPARGTDVVHADRTVRSDELVHDLHLSDQHEEREVVRYSPTGIAFSFEGGSITFGPGTQTSQATYDPLMVQVPFPLAAGATASGSSAARSGNATARVEDWTTKVVGQQVLTILGQPRTTWVIDIQRTTKPGGAEQVSRFRRYWYDPTLGVWVKWTERFHASRDLLVDFSYDTTYTATLAAFTPA